MIRVAIVCLGNICRSPMAAAVARAMVAEAGLEGRVAVESFGTADYHVGRPADRQARAALERRGWPSEGHRARQITADAIDAFDLILCADRFNRSEVLGRARPGTDLSKIRLLRWYDPLAGENAEVPDPFGQHDAGFDRSLDMIERACRGLVASLVASVVD